MKFSEVFTSKDNIQLDKRTLVILRWIAIIGQLVAINLVYNYLNLEFPIIESHLIIFVGLIEPTILLLLSITVTDLS